MNTRGFDLILSDDHHGSKLTKQLTAHANGWTLTAWDDGVDVELRVTQHGEDTHHHHFGLPIGDRHTMQPHTHADDLRTKAATLRTLAHRARSAYGGEAHSAYTAAALDDAANWFHALAEKYERPTEEPTA